MNRAAREYEQVPFLIPSQYTDVRTGHTRTVSSIVQEQIQYHSRNRTLTHLVFSALHAYLERQTDDGFFDEVLSQLSDIKRLLHQGAVTALKPASVPTVEADAPLNMEEVEELLDAFTK